MSLFKRSGPWTPEPFVSPFPGTGLFGGSAGGGGLDASMRVSAVWACIRLLSDTISMMPVQSYTMRNGVRVPTELPSLLKSPHPEMTTAEWVSMMVVSVMLRGNAINIIRMRDRNETATMVESLNPDKVTVKYDNQGRLTYIVTGGQKLENRDVFHVRGLRLPGAAVGLSPISYAARTLATEGAVANFALGYFEDGLNPSAVVTTEQPVNQTQAKAIKARIVESVTGREPLILGAGLKMQPLAVSPNESQFLETQKYGVTQIARIFGVPPEMIGGTSGDSMKYANVEQRAIDFLTYTVQPWLSRFENAMSTLLPGQQHVKFDTSVLIRTDLESRIKAGAIAIASKQQTPDEVRAWSDLAPLTQQQKDVLELVPLTVSPTGLPKALHIAPSDQEVPA